MPLKDFETCPNTADHKHKPDIQTVRPVEGSADCVDVWCSACGMSGSLAVNLSDLSW